MTFEEFRSAYVGWYKAQLKKNLTSLEGEHRPKKADDIVQASVAFLDEAALKTAFDEHTAKNQGGVNAQGFFDDLGDDFGDFLTKIDPTHPDNRKAVCVAGSMAAAAALLAAWVASGGTLTFGMVVGGIKITEPILAALIGGGGAAAVASAMC